MTDMGDSDRSGESGGPEAEWAEEELGRFLRLKHWKVEEATYLLIGLNPWAAKDLLPGDDPYVYLPFGGDPEHRDTDPEARRYNIEGDLELTQRYITAAEIAGPQTPREFLTLAAENGHRVPWLPWALSRPVLRRFLPEGEGDHAKALEELRGTIARLTAEMDQLCAEKEAQRPLAGKARVTALRLIGGMARAGWGLDLIKPATEAFQELHSDLEKIGAKVSKNTLRTYITEAAEHVDEPPDAGDG